MFVFILNVCDVCDVCDWCVCMNVMQCNAMQCNVMHEINVYIYSVCRNHTCSLVIC